MIEKDIFRPCGTMLLPTDMSSQLSFLLRRALMTMQKRRFNIDAFEPETEGTLCILKSIGSTVLDFLGVWLGGLTGFSTSVYISIVFSIDDPADQFRVKSL